MAWHASWSSERLVPGSPDVPRRGGQYPFSSRDVEVAVAWVSDAGAWVRCGKEALSRSPVI